MRLLGRIVILLVFTAESLFAKSIKVSEIKYKVDFNEDFKILVVAGQLNKVDNLTSDVELIDPFIAKSNCVKPDDYPLKTSEITGSAGTFCGGSFENTHNNCYQYLEQNKTWITIGSLNYRRYAASSVLAKGNYWITGGGLLNGGTDLTTSEILKNNIGPIVQSSDLPEQLRHHCMSTINETHVFIAGGDWSSKSAYLVDVSIEPFGFLKLPPMLENRSGAACGTIVWPYSPTSTTNDFLVIVAGGNYYDITDSSTTSEFYSPLANVWVNGPTLPRGFIKGGYFTTKEYSLIMVGGQDENGSQRSDVMAFGNVLSSIEFLPGKLDTAREAFAAIAINTDEKC